MSNGPSINLTPTSVQAAPPGSFAKSVCPEKDMYVEDDRGKEYFENFSKGLFRTRLGEYNAGKLTKRYMEAYLEFVHLSGYISNLDYLEFKTALAKE